ncbi:hypothetical protein [Pseudomonas aeruginosa]|uniref:hypothetical protein n=1 Tax=Pseudomonas aeruginosa TaxID=287 RepID=UPI001CA5184F|nr:hypothetical protein [Pseudomonas aeruginosa]MBW6072547.1 hypothetical protein [Pseudomonas aeruginosa]
MKVNLVGSKKAITALLYNNNVYSFAFFAETNRKAIEAYDPDQRFVISYRRYMPLWQKIRMTIFRQYSDQMYVNQIKIQLQTDKTWETILDVEG